MKKLSLELDGIRVESFETDAARRARGTVRGRLDAFDGDSPLASCMQSCEDTICATCGTCRHPCPSEVCETVEQAAA
ncbi:MAG TPA: hypothetical protein VFR81_29240 [Longimicrobium sp.]|nr:hypothetical protein [Longimicrobium sp.]